MRQNQETQIKKANNAYIIRLTDHKLSVQRFSVYLDNQEGFAPMGILWPEDSHNGKKSKELLPSQVYSKNQKYPAYHFSLNGCGYSKQNDIAMELQRINPALNVYELAGGQPSLVRSGEKVTV